MTTFWRCRPTTRVVAQTLNAATVSFRLSGGKCLLALVAFALDTACILPVVSWLAAR